MTVNHDIMDRLKAETSSLHDEAEHHPFQSRLVKGQLSREGYVRYLTAKFHTHAALEGAITRATGRCDAITSIRLDDRFREGALRRDLAHFGVKAGDTDPLPSVSQLGARFRSALDSAPVSLLGYFYVLEGSANGTHFVARAVRRTYGLAGSSGTEYLDPYGDDQRSQWARFKRQMRAIALAETQEDEIVEAAKTMFRGIMTVSDELIAGEPSESETEPRSTEGSSAERSASDTSAAEDQVIDGHAATTKSL